MKIQVSTHVNAPLEKVWSCWIVPKDIVQWNFATEDWICPRAENEFKVGGHFNYRMEARDGSVGFDLKGTYVRIQEHELIEFELEDKRLLQVLFSKAGNAINVTGIFDAEAQNSAEMQKQGWQSILNNFKAYVERKDGNL